MQNVIRNRIINCEERSSLLNPNCILTWAQTKTTGNEKENITVVASVTAAGDKFPLQFMAGGETVRVEGTQIGSVDEY
jgi:hypothetical protein